MKAPMKNLQDVRVAGLTALCLLSCGCDKSVDARRIDSLESEIRSLKSSLGELQSRLEQVHTQVANVSGRLSNVGENVREVQNETTELRQPEGDLPYGIPAVGQTGKVYSPFAADKGLVDVTDMKRGTRIKCPYTGRHFRVP